MTREVDTTPSPPEPQRLAPERPARERSPLPDLLRGLAMLGILTVNLQDFSGYLEWQQTGLDRIAQVLIDVFANGRFISIFAMLFGWGAWGFLRSRRLFLRRHLALLGLGTLHGLLVWHGDIIMLYATLAFGLLLLARAQPRALVTVAAALGGWWLFSNLATVTLGGTGPVAEARPNFLPPIALGQSYAEVLSVRAQELFALFVPGVLFSGPWLFALFCLGAAARERELLTRPERFGALWRRLVWLALPAGLALGGLLAWLNTQDTWQAAMLALPVRMGGGLLGALGYVGLLAQLVVRGRAAGGLPGALSASGRVALSNYLAQSLVMTTLFYPYAGAQWGSWGAASGLALALAFGLLQLPLSRWWLARLGTGPVEWLLRRLIYR